MVITNEPLSTFERGGCSQATGCTLRATFPTSECAFERAVQVRVSHLNGDSLSVRSLNDASFSVCTSPSRTWPADGNNDADAYGTTRSAAPTTSAAITARMCTR